MFRTRSRIPIGLWAVIVVAVCLSFWLSLPQSLRDQVHPTAHAASTYVVNTMDDHDDGVCNTADCTLREAINAANAGSGGDTITFNIGGQGVHTINAKTGFTITKAVTIDGTTQPGFSGAPLIELNGAGAGAVTDGLNVNASNVTIKGLVINRFSHYAINFDYFGNNTVQACYIGTNATGTAASPNYAGIRIGVSGITIGGTTPAARNVISGNAGDGIDIWTGSSTIQGNYLGTNAAGTAAVANGVDGVHIWTPAGSCTIGGTNAGAGNLISGNSLYGVEITSTNGGNLVQGNLIGTNAAGTAALANRSHGVVLKNGTKNNMIGGTVTTARNVISGNPYGVAIFGPGTSGNQVQGNYIGTDVTGTATIAGPLYYYNSYGVGIYGGATNNTVGGTTGAGRNVISSYDFLYPIGVLISDDGTDNNTVAGNYIGTNADGTAALGNFYGVDVEPGVQNTTIGGTTVGAGNVISGNVGGIFVSGGSGTSILGNFIGLNATGTGAIGNTIDGISITGGSATVGGTAPGSRNVISGNSNPSGSLTGVGISIFGGTSTQVLGNFIGTDPTGTSKNGNQIGITIEFGYNNQIGGVTIGGTTAAARNIISGNTSVGVRLNSAINTVIQGNFIGTDVSGTAAIGNYNGVVIQGTAQNNTIGGTAMGAGNVITGNTSSGVSVSGGSGTSILGNLIGPNAAGTQALGNSIAGVSISGGSATVGGTAPGSRNIISGNSRVIVGRPRPEQSLGGGGVVILGGTGSQVLGNTIGGSIPASGQQSNGVIINGAANNVVGGTTPTARNEISGHAFVGVSILGTGATNNFVQGNLIQGNDEDGIEISGARNNVVGGMVAGAGNVITNNGITIFSSSGSGVLVQGGTSNAVLGNSIFSNGGLGIDVGPAGVTPNDNCESAVGPNINPQNFPVITSAVADSTTTTIRGTLNSSPNTQFRIEFFANSDCDPSGNGEGQNFLGYTNATTDAACVANFVFSLPNSAVTGPIITATATDPKNNTSEFSACVSPTGGAPTIQFNATSYMVGEGEKRIDIPITRSGDTGAAASVSFATSDLAFAQNCNVVNGVASSRCDYEARLATVNFAPGETSKIISVYIIDDSYLEGPETFNLRLTNAVGALLGAPSEATVTIMDNDLANGPNPIDSPGFLVRVHYLDFLNREPDQNGFDFWTGQISSCGSDQPCIAMKRINVSASFFLSIEFQQTGYFVERIYKTAFGDSLVTSALGGSHTITAPSVRLTDFLLDTQQIGAGVIVGQSGWETALESNKRAFTLDFVRRSRFLSRYATGMTPSQFVDQLFANAGFMPSNTDRNAAVAEFGSATNSGDVAARARALRDVAENPRLVSEEFNRAFVLMEYFGYLRRNPNEVQDTDYSGYDFWLNKLNAFNGDFQKAEMVKAFITSSEYRQRFGP